MKIFNFLKRNKNAINKDRTVLDFTNANNNFTGRDSTSFACIDLIASSFASLTGGVYDIETKEKIKTHPIYQVLKEPNLDETRNTFFYQCVKDYFDGNVYLLKALNDKGELISLFRLNPSAVFVSRSLETNQKIYTYNGIRYTSNEVLHIPSRYGYNGLKGMSIFNECNVVFNNATSLDSYTNNSFNNSIGKRVVIDIQKAFPNATSDEIKKIQKSYISNYSGIENAGKPFVKTNNVELSTLDSEINDNRSSQLIENRSFQEKDISKLFGVPLAFLDGSYTKDLESSYTVFIQNAIKPIALSFEQSFNKLLPPYDRDRFYFEYNYNSLLKTSINTRIDSYTKQITNGILSPNEVRKKENLPSIEAGDTVFIPANMMPLTDEIVASYMASAKQKQSELEKDSSGIGDDKK